MSSITQIYQLELKNLIKMKLSSLVGNIADELITNILNPNDDKYIKILSNLEENVKKLIIQILLETISFLDEKYRNSQERKRYYHINVIRDHRSITTLIGTLNFNRTYYESKDRKEHFYFIDQLLGLDKYARYDCNTKASVIDLTTKTNQKFAGEIILQNSNSFMSSSLHHIPRQTVNRWIKNWHIPMIQYEPIDISGDTLYIMGDEKWIHEQIYNCSEEDKNKHHFIMSKEFVCFSGIEQQGKRRILKDRFVFITSSSTPWNGFLDTVSQVYDFEKLNKIVFLSDAGSWLISGAPDLKLYSHNRIIMCLCEFHVRQKVNRITTNKDYRTKLNQFIDEDNKIAFKNLMNIIKNEKKDKPDRVKKLEEYEAYITKNWNKIKNMASSDCKSSMESHISHYIARYFSSRPKAFSRNMIENHLKLQEAKTNHIDIKTLFLKSYKNLEIVSYNQKELVFSVSQNTSSSNIPIIENGKIDFLFSSLIGLAHS